MHIEWCARTCNGMLPLKGVVIVLLLCGLVACQLSGQVEASLQETAPPAASAAVPTTSAESAASREPEPKERVKTLDLANGVTLELVWISPGSFTMGARAEGEPSDMSELPAHRVTLTRGFWIGKYEVTQAQWMAMMRNNPSRIRQSDTPVDSVSWDDCQQFLDVLNTEFGHLHFRLPTEAEWEYACRAGTLDRGTFVEEGDSLGDYAWHEGNSGGVSHPVGQKKPNPWGLYDMLGNVAEWCQDRYWPYGEDSKTDPTGPPTNSGAHVVRGGSYEINTLYFTTAKGRNCGFHSGSYEDYGFRVVADDPSSAL